MKRSSQREGTLLPDAQNGKQKIIGDSPVSLAHGPAVRQPRTPLPPKPPTGTCGKVPPPTNPLPPWRFERGRWEKPKLEVPDRAMLGAFVLDDLYRRACAQPIYSAASALEGVHQLIGHQPDLREFATALALIVEGERGLAKLREHLAGTDADFEAAFEAPFVAATPLLGSQVRQMVQLVPELAEYAEAQARIEHGVATMTTLSSYLASL